MAERPEALLIDLVGRGHGPPAQSITCTVQMLMTCSE